MEKRVATVADLQQLKTELLKDIKKLLVIIYYEMKDIEGMMEKKLKLLVSKSVSEIGHILWWLAKRDIN